MWIEEGLDRLCKRDSVLAKVVGFLARVPLEFHSSTLPYKYGKRHIPQGTGFDVPVLPEKDPRWQRLRLDPGQGVDLRDHFRGALMGGAIDPGRAPSRGPAGERHTMRPAMALVA